MLLLAVLVAVLLCAVVLNLKLGGVERTLNSANTKLDELKQTVSQLQEAQAQQSEVLNELKQAVDAAQGKAPAAEPAASVPGRQRAGDPAGEQPAPGRRAPEGRSARRGKHGPGRRYGKRGAA